MSRIPVSTSGIFTAIRGTSPAQDLGNVAAITAALAGFATTGDGAAAAGDLFFASPRAGALGVALALFPGFAFGGGAANAIIANPSAGGLDPAAQDFDWSVMHASFNRPASGVVCFDKKAITLDVANCPADAVTTQALTIPGAEVGDTVILVPPAGFPANLAIGLGGVSAADTAQMPFVNPTLGAIDPGSLAYTVIILKETQRAAPYGDRACIRGLLAAFNPPNTLADSVGAWNVAIAEALPGDCGVITTQLGTGLALAVGRCDVAGTLIVPALNVTAGAIDPGAADYHFVLFR